MDNTPDYKNDTMTRHILTLLICISTFTSFAQTDKSPCRDLDFIVNKTIETINNQDVNAYLSLVDYDAMLTMFAEAAAKDTSVKAIYEQMKTRKELVTAMYHKSFSELIATIEKDLEKHKWKLKLNDYYTESKQEDPSYVHHTLILKITVDKQKYHLMMTASKYKDCYYIFEPIMPYFSSGWQ